MRACFLSSLYMVCFAFSNEIDMVHSLERGVGEKTILKIPKRLRVVFFFADTRMMQRGLMVRYFCHFHILIMELFPKRV